MSGESARAATDFVGTWRLVSFESRDDSGTLEYPFGEGVAGQLLYDARGNMSAMIMKRDRGRFASPDLLHGTDAEVRAAFDSFIAYFGNYTVDAAAGTVTHHVLAASYPNWVGGDQVRYYKFAGRRLILSTPSFREGGRSLTTTAVWEGAP